MPRQAKPAQLNLQLTQEIEKPGAPRPTSSPIHLEGVDLSSFSGGFRLDDDLSLHGLPPLPLSPPPPDSPSFRRRDGSPNFFSSFGEKMNLDFDHKDGKVQESRPAGQEVLSKEDYRPGAGSMSKIYHLRNTPGSTPELSLVGSADSIRKTSYERMQSTEPQPEVPAQHQDDNISLAKRKDRQFRNPLSRSKSIRRDSSSKPNSNFEQPPKTAPLQPDWPGSDARMFGKGSKDKSRRGKSSERVGGDSIYDTASSTSWKMNSKDKEKEKDKEAKSGLKASGQNVMSKAKTGGGNLFNRLVNLGKNSGSHSSHTTNDSRIPDNEYVLKVLRLPLPEQTRITRLSKNLADSRDKTEFWMPSLPWRCIDYLNQKCDDTGLYRVPGSLITIRHWTRRFDEELDIDLFNEDGPDPNDIASLLKDWFRGLPTELFPKSLQQALATQIEKENPNYSDIGEIAPQCLRDAISNLPPFNYYLLFAITCHLSLLLAHKDKNKMDLNNLAICVMPCLSLDRWLFNFLVGDWKRCWQGCYTEKHAADIERLIASGVDPDDLATAQVHTSEGIARAALPPRSISAERSRAPSSATSRAPSRSRLDNPNDENSASHPLPPTTGRGTRVEQPSQRDGSETRKAENAKPQVYIPTGMNTAATKPGSSFNLGVETDGMRPASADDHTYRTASEGHVSDAEDVEQDETTMASPDQSHVTRGPAHHTNLSDLTAAAGMGASTSRRAW